MQVTQLLATALGYPIRIPPAPITRSIRMLFKEKPAEEPKLMPAKPVYVKPQKEKPLLGESEVALLKAIKKHKKLKSSDAAKVTRWTANHCGMVMAKLYSKGYLSRYKDKGNHTRWYVYSIKEGE